MWECPTCKKSNSTQGTCDGSNIYFGQLVTFFACAPHPPVALVEVPTARVPTVGQRVKVTNVLLGGVIPRGKITVVDSHITIDHGGGAFTMCAVEEYGSTVLPDDGPYVGQRVKYTNPKHGSWYAEVLEVTEGRLHVNIDRVDQPNGMKTPDDYWFALDCWMRDDAGIFPDDSPALSVPAVIRSHCNRCHEPNTYSHPGENWTCTGCKLWERYQ